MIASVFSILNTEIAITRDGSVGDGTLDAPRSPRFNFDRPA